MTRRSLLATAAAPLARPTGQAAARRPSIVLISGWNLYNIGDVAITPGFLRMVQKYFPEARVTVLLASYPNELGEYLRRRFPDVTTMPLEFQGGKKISAETEAAFAGADLLALNSGMTLSYGYYGVEFERYMPRLLPFMKASELKIPFGIWGHSFDKIEPPADIMWRDVLNRAAFIYTRDTESLKVLKSKGIASAEMGFSSDSTFSFDLRDEPAAKAFYGRHKLEPGKFAALVPRLDVNRFRNDGREKEHAAQTRALIEKYVAAAQEPLVLVHEVTRMLEPVKTMIFDQLSEAARKYVRYEPDYWMPDAAATVYRDARMLVSMEMHSPIMALAAGTPSIHPYFKEAGLKQWMYRDIGLPEWLIDQDENPAESISGAMLTIYKDTPGARAKVKRAMDFVHERQRASMAVLKRAAMDHFKRS